MRIGSATVYHGDCVDVLKALPDASIDAVVTDPPYGLEFMQAAWDAPWKASGGTLQDPAEAGGFQDGNGGNAFSRSRVRYGMSDMQGFGAWCETWAAECYRVLKPGGHILAFGGTRTWHRLACAIEDVGFEVRDSIAWLYGSGFPKSLDVAKAIDKASGAEGTYGEPKSAAHAGWLERGSMRGTEGDDGWQRPWMDDEEAVDRAARVYEPGSDAASRWKGWGTALKPAFEPVVVARKPLAGTVAQNVLAHGTGALNIDANRIGMSDEDRERFARGSEAWVKMSKSRGDVKAAEVYGTYGINDPSEAHAAGRWPANVVLGHTEWCVLVGEQTVTGDGHHPASRGPGGIATTGHGGQGGLVERSSGEEVVEAWECVPGCPVAELDSQSGDRPGGAFPAQRGRAVATGFGEGSPTPGGPRIMGDGGGASRFFYTAKANSSERPRVRKESGDGDTSTTIGSGLKIRECRVCGSRAMPGNYVKGDPRPWPSCGHNDWEMVAQLPPSGDYSMHPTVKPLDLMRWLVRLVTPPGGTVLDPFLGSGTTAEAALAEGFKCVGVEREDDYIDLIRWRLNRRFDPEAYLRDHHEAEDGQPSLFDA